MLADFQMPVAEDEHDRKLLSDVTQYGWHVPHILADDSGPGYSFSVGLYLKFGHPQILVMGLSQPVAHQLINLAASHISSGKAFRPRERTNDLAQDFCLQLRSDSGRALPAVSRLRHLVLSDVEAAISSYAACVA
jgi:hypothetical protein